MSDNTKVNVEFKVAMDAEAKKAGDVKTVKFTIDFEGVSDDVVRKAAIANQVVGWQGQIRNHWRAFLDGKLPEVVTFGTPLFGGRRATVVRKPTEEEMAEYMQKRIASMTPEEIKEFAQTGKLPAE